MRRPNTDKNSDALNDLLRFEHFLSEISAKYINLPAREIEEAILNDLGRLVDFLDADRGVLYLSSEGSPNKMSFPPLLAWPIDSNDPVRRRFDAVVGKDQVSADALQYLFDRWFKGEQIQFTHTSELPEEAWQVRKFYDEIGLKSFLSVPLAVSGSVVGALVVSTVRTHRSWPKELIPRIRLFAEAFGNALTRKRSEERLQAALAEITALKEQIEADYIYLREEINVEHDFGEIIGKSGAIRGILRKIKQVANTNATVLLLGETGTGKGLFARTIHNVSAQKHRPLIQVNCASLAPSLIESELFGHEKGAFTGALTRRLGRFETAGGSTLFLDEIGELPLGLQAKLLRVLQEGEFERVGGTSTLKVNVRIIAATNRDLEKEVRAGKFRSDLWYRLSTFPIFVPPLRERTEDIPLYLKFFVDKYCRMMRKNFDAIPHKTIKALQGYSWPGNIREIENLVERAVITSTGDILQIELPERPSGSSPHSDESLNTIERDHIISMLETTRWKVSGPGGAAQRLRMNPSTLRARIKKLKINRSSRTED